MDNTILFLYSILITLGMNVRILLHIFLNYYYIGITIVIVLFQVFSYFLVMFVLNLRRVI